MAATASVPSFLTETTPAIQDITNHLSSLESNTESSLDEASSSSNSPSPQPCSLPIVTSKSSIKCSAIHTLERDMPTFDYSPILKQFADKVLAEFKANPHLYLASDVEKFKADRWNIERYLLRRHLDIDDSFDLITKSLRYNREAMLNCGTAEFFPFEFYRMAGIFGYEPDRKGNLTLYLRSRMHKRIPEIVSIFEAFIYYNIKKIDDDANGRGISIVIDVTGAGVANADLEIVTFLLQVLSNYFPKGLSYLLVHNLPWILKPFWYLVKAWLTDEQKGMIKFSDSKTIYEYIDEENLPDFMGGTCKRDYRVPPPNCATIYDMMKLLDLDVSTVAKIRDKYYEHLPEDALASLDSCLATFESTLSDENEKRILKKFGF